MRAARWAFVLCCAGAATPLAHAQDAASLRARYGALDGRLVSAEYQRPLYLESTMRPDALSGDIYALFDQPFAIVGPSLKDLDHWCDILILHLNVKGCRVATSRAGKALRVNVGRKFDQPLADTYLFEFQYARESQPDYVQVDLTAPEGPIGTSNYRIILEVVAIDPARSFIHLSYSYDYALPARVAMRGYLATIGRGKVGFSVVETKANGQPVYIDGVRGVVERNTMRYFLAIEAYLGALSAPDKEQLEKRLNGWFTAAERYPAQLHEMDRPEYLSMKRREVQRQQVPVPGRP